jgi:outer membrane protein OmpA-like peptidoglycan-associated protein
MKKSFSRVVWTVGLVGISSLAIADPATPPKVTPPQEPIGFVTGGVIGGLAAGPIGAVVGAGFGTWLGNRVHRASEAKKAEAEVAALEAQKKGLEANAIALESDRARLAEMNRSLTVQVDALTTSVKAVQMAKSDPAEALDGLQGDVLFRTGSAEITPDVAHQIEVLAQAIQKSPELKIRVDGYADPRGTENANLKLSEARANAVRDLLLAAGVNEAALEVNAYGKTLSVADDEDGFALERRVRLTLLDTQAAVAKTDTPAIETMPAGATMPASPTTASTSSSR